MNMPSPTSSLNENNIRFRWRADLAATARRLGGKDGVLIEDPISGAFHQLGQREYAVASRLNGAATSLEAMEQAAAAEGIAAFTADERMLFVRRLVELQLVELLDLNGNVIRMPAARPPRGFDPFFIRVPLLAPQRVLDSLLPWTRTLFSFPAFAAAVTATLWLTIQIADRRREFSESFSQFFLPQQHLVLLGCWLVLKVIHETAHGLVCRKYGGYVREAGVSFIFLAPAPYVDVTSAWRFSDRRQRIAVSAAGMYAEWWCAILCGFLWLGADDAAVRHVCVYVITLATAATVLFNANPLMRFDGYFILSDLIDFPNLYSVAQKRLHDRVTALLWGVAPPADSTSGGRRLVAAVYGPVSWMWRVSTLVVLALTTIWLYDGVGIALVFVAGLLWFGRGLAALITRSAVVLREPTRLIRPLLICGGGAAALSVLLQTCSWPFAPQSPGVIRLADERYVRAEAPGFVRELSVVEGDTVALGQVIAVLENDQLLLECKQLESEVARSAVKVRTFEQKRELAHWQAEAANHEALVRQWTEKRERVEGLKVRAPTAGRIFARRLGELAGRYLHEGDLICTIGDDRLQEAMVAVSQENSAKFALEPNVSVTITTAGGEQRLGRVVSIEPRAVRQPIEASLAAVNGGDLPVREVRDPQRGAVTLELLEPHFTAKVRLDEAAGNQVFAGQRCVVRPASWNQSIADRLWGEAESRLRRLRKA